MKNFVAKYRELLVAFLVVITGLIVYQLAAPETPEKYPEALHPSDSVHEGPVPEDNLEASPMDTGLDIWTCSMHPQIRQYKPGKCPICGMDLVLIKKTDANRSAVEVESIQTRPLFKEIRSAGKLSFDESRIASITARVSGRVDRLYVDFTGSSVSKGQHIVDIYSPELLVAQRELLLAAKGNGLPADLRDAARSKLLLWGLQPTQISEIEKSGQPRTRITIFSPEGGVVTEKNVREGQYVKEGDVLYQVAKLDPIWLNAEIYEYDLSWIHVGQPVRVTVEAYPGEIFEGSIVFVSPSLDDSTRTVKTRINLKNTDGRLKPNMYAAAFIRAQMTEAGQPVDSYLHGHFVCPMHPEIIRKTSGHCPICGMALVKISGDLADEQKVSGILSVRASAVLDTGERKLVYRKTSQGDFDPIEVNLGPVAVSEVESGRKDRYYPVISGLSEGDEVAVRGVFLLDSQRQIEGKPSLLYPDGQTGESLHGRPHGGH